MATVSFEVFFVALLFAGGIIMPFVFMASDKETKCYTVLAGNPDSTRPPFQKTRDKFPKKVRHKGKEYKTKGNVGIVKGDDLGVFGLYGNRMVSWIPVEKLTPDIIGYFVIIDGCSNTHSQINPLAEVNSGFDGKLIRKAVGIIDDAPTTEEEKRQFVAALEKNIKDFDSFYRIDVDKLMHNLEYVSNNPGRYLICLRKKDNTFDRHAFICELYPESEVQGKVIYNT